jgi:hypothetical protein
VDHEAVHSYDGNCEMFELFYINEIVAQIAAVTNCYGQQYKTSK